MEFRKMSHNRVFWACLLLLFLLSFVTYRFHLPQPPFIIVFIGSIAFILFFLSSPSLLRKLEGGGLNRSFLLAELYRDALFLPFITLPLARAFPCPKVFYSIGIFGAVGVGLLQIYAYQKSVIGRKELIMSLSFMVLAAVMNFWLMT